MNADEFLKISEETLRLYNLAEGLGKSFQQKKAKELLKKIENGEVEGCGKEIVNYEAHNETGEPIPCELLICGDRRWLCKSCQLKLNQAKKNFEEVLK